MGGARERAIILEDIASKVRGCTLCRLHQSRTCAVPGEGPIDAHVFLIGEAPGRQEDAAGQPFVGSAGKVLNKALAAARLSREDVFITNVVKCRPPANRAPTADEIEACRPYLRSQIEAVRPRVLVSLGSTALRMNAEGRILLLRKSGEQIWCLPKGTLEPGETTEETAVREVHEETGLHVKLLGPLTEVRYAFYWPPDGVNVDKTVTYFLATPIGGRVKPEPGFDEGRWVTRTEAMKLLHWPNDREIVTRAFDATRSLGPSGGSRGSSPGAKRSARRSR
ncbi:MAG: NUDIX domain-containing protein [Methanobacteriota archaeon]|nr:MAG: NUDIX domain-containing protein [Euryarchaeota archaeon]